MAQWSEKAQQQKRDENAKAFRDRTAQLMVPVIARRLSALKLLRKNGWQVRVILPLPIEWHSYDTVVIDDIAALREVNFLFKMPGAAEMMCRTIEELERKTFGMRQI